MPTFAVVWQEETGSPPVAGDLEFLPDRLRFEGHRGDLEIPLAGVRSARVGNAVAIDRPSAPRVLVSALLGYVGLAEVAAAIDRAVTAA